MNCKQQQTQIHLPRLAQAIEGPYRRKPRRFVVLTNITLVMSVISAAVIVFGG